MSKVIHARRLLQAAAIVLISVVVLAVWPATAKHAATHDDTDSDSESSTAPADVPAAGRGTVITGQFVESHDLLSDSGDSSNPVSAGIQWSHNFTIVLSGKNHVAEKWNNVRSNKGTASAARGHSRQENRLGNVRQLTTGQENSVTIGSTGGNAVWHVLGDKKLQRIFPGQHFIMMMNIEIGADNACALEVKYLRQEGFTSIVMRQANNGMMSNFSLPQVESQSCAIQ